jgi:hypothetical protein
VYYQTHSTRQEVFIRLAFDPDEEAQVDWHTGWIIANGIERKAQFFCIRLCYSKASFVIAYERADKRCRKSTYAALANTPSFIASTINAPAYSSWRMCELSVCASPRS